MHVLGTCGRKVNVSIYRCDDGRRSRERTVRSGWRCQQSTTTRATNVQPIIKRFDTDNVNLTNNILRRIIFTFNSVNLPRRILMIHHRV